MLLGNNRIQIRVEGKLIWEGTLGEWSFALANPKQV